MKDLTTSITARKNILHNNYALSKIEFNLALQGVNFNNDEVFTKKHAAEFLEIDEKILDEYLNLYSCELKESGYAFIESKNLGIFTFKSFLNLMMLIPENEKAKVVRSMVLDIVLDSIAEKTGGKVKFDYSNCFLKENAIQNKPKNKIQQMSKDNLNDFLNEQMLMLYEKLSEPEVLKIFERLRYR